MSYATQRVNQRDYLGTVDEVVLNDRLAAVRSEGRVSVHVIEHAEDPTVGPHGIQRHRQCSPRSDWMVSLPSSMNT